jgi:molybdopterin-guanine dinucleotide biosynthesis protein
MICRRIRPPVSGLVVIVGGQCRKVGKTALIEDLIRAFPERKWTAVKVTPYAAEGCPVNGARCKCHSYQHEVAIRAENYRKGSSDTSRFLAAGAKRALWVQTKEGRLGDALPRLEQALAGAASVIIESDALVRFWQPDIFLMVLDPRKADFKVSARGVAHLVNVFVLRSPDFGRGVLQNGADHRRPRFLHPLGHPLPSRMQTLVRQQFQRPRHLTLGHAESFQLTPS